MRPWREGLRKAASPNPTQEKKKHIRFFPRVAASGLALLYGTDFDPPTACMACTLITLLYEK